MGDDLSDQPKPKQPEPYNARHAFRCLHPLGVNALRQQGYPALADQVEKAAEKIRERGWNPDGSER